MSKQKFNRVQVMFNAEHKPYLYGAIHIVDGTLPINGGNSPS